MFINLLIIIKFFKWETRKMTILTFTWISKMINLRKILSFLAENQTMSTGI